MLADSVPGEGPFPALYTVVFSLWPHMLEEDEYFNFYTTAKLFSKVTAPLYIPTDNG